MESFYKFFESIEEKHAFERNIDTNPLDWQNQLVYADWLDENSNDYEEKRYAAFRRSMGNWLKTEIGQKCNDPSQVPEDLSRAITYASLNTMWPDMDLQVPEPFPWVVAKPQGNTNNTLPQGVYSSNIRTLKIRSLWKRPLALLTRGYYSWPSYRDMEETFNSAFNFEKMRSLRKK